MAMKVFQVVLIVLVAACLINFVRQGSSFHIAEVLPFAGGHKAGIYDLAAILLIALAQVRRLTQIFEEVEW